MASTLEQDLLKKTVVELRTILRQGGQPVGGTKPMLIQRILEANLYTPSPPPVVPAHVIAPAGQPAYTPPTDEAQRLRESLRAFILGAFDENNFERARSMDDYHDGWAEIGDYGEFIRKQEAELARMDLPMLQALNQLASLIQLRRINMMDKEDMGMGWKSDGFILVDGNVIITHPR
jgi:hypothetical protein